MAAIFACLIGLSGFDNPLREMSWLEAAGTTLVDILGFPGIYIWERLQFAPRLPDILEWLTLVANSLLWGFTLAFLVAKNSSDKSN